MAYQPIGGQISTVNSTTAALLANGVFTGTSEDVSQYASVNVFVFASHVSATDGLSLQFSVDGTNWDNADVYTIPATTGKTFAIQIVAKFFRVVYTNGATAQTTLRLQTIFHSVMDIGSSIRPQDGRGNDNDMGEVLGHGMVYNGTSWDRARGDITNGLDVDVTRLPALPVGANTIGNVNVVGTVPVSLAVAPSTPVTGTFFQATQPVSLATAPTTPVTGTFFQATQPVSLAVNTPVIAAGTAIVGKVGIDQTTPGTTNLVALAANQTVAQATAANLNATVSIATAQTLATVTTVSAVTAITNALPTGANTIGAVNIAAAQTLATVTTVGAVTAITNALPTGANTIGTVNTTPTTPTAFTLSSAATTNATSVKATAGTVYSITASNVGATAAFLKIFNTAAAPTVGTTVPVLTIPIAASGVQSINLGTQGMRLGTGIALSITNLVADADATVIAAAQVKVMISYI